MIEVCTRKKAQVPPPHYVWESLADPTAVSARSWLILADDEVAPEVEEAVKPSLVVWSSLWAQHPLAVIRFDIAPSGDGTDLRWTILAPPESIDDAEARRLRYRMDTLVNGRLRRSFGQ
jgi:hypothetical protein